MPFPWPGRRPALAPEVQQALAEVERLAGERDELADAARTLQRLLVASFGVADPEPAPAWPDPALPPERLRAAIAGGGLAFAAAPPPLDARALAERARRLCEALRPDNPGVEVFDRAIRRAPDSVAAHLALALAGDEPSLPPGLDVSRRDTWACLVRLAALPTLAALTARIGPDVLAAGPTDRATCPACGDAPVLAEERGLERRRWLRCGRCAGSWPAARLACPGCGTADHRLLRHLAVEGEEDRRRVVVCAACEGRLKVVATLGPLSPPGLLVAELAASHLDYVGLPAADGESPAPSV
jgi:ribosomal protein S27AE